MNASEEGDEKERAGGKQEDDDDVVVVVTDAPDTANGHVAVDDVPDAGDGASAFSGADGASVAEGKSRPLSTKTRGSVATAASTKTRGSVATALSVAMTADSNEAVPSSCAPPTMVDLDDATDDSGLAA